MISFLDTSALIKLFVDEDGTPAVQRELVESEMVAVAAIAYVEAHSALVRMRAAKRLTVGRFRAKRSELEGLWPRLAVVDISPEVIEGAADLAVRHVLRAYDAVQLASALVVEEAGEIRFACWDEELGRAAREEGLTLVAG